MSALGLRAVAVPVGLALVAATLLAPMPAFADESPALEQMPDFSASEFVEQAAEMPAELVEALARDVDQSPEEYLAQAAAATVAVEVVDGLTETGVDVLGSRLEGTQLVVNVESAGDADLVRSVGASAEIGEPQSQWSSEGVTPEFAEDTYGGQSWIYEVAGNDWYLCTLGFNGIALPSGEGEIATAGHCTQDMISNGAIWNQSSPGSSGSAGTGLGVRVPGATFLGSGYDVGRLGSGYNAVLKPAIATWGGGTGSPLSSTRSVTGDAKPITGSTVCKSGGRTGWTCGPIVAVDDVVDVCVEACGTSGEVLEQVRSMVAQICVRGGDSGGPAVIGNKALGITSWSTSGSGGCTSNTYGGFFQMVSPGGYESVAQQYNGTWELSATVSSPTITSISGSGGSDTAINGTVTAYGMRYSVDLYIDGSSSVFATANVNPANGSWSVNVSALPTGIHSYSAVARYGTYSTSTPTAGFIKRGMTIGRIFGANRYETSAAIAGGFSGSDTVYLANGQKYPDALSAASLAGAKNAPLLLTEPGALPTSIRDAIAAVHPKKVVILGGPDSISDTVLNTVRNLVQGLDSTATVERVAGVNRYATSQLISARFGTSTKAYVATGQNFPDALSAAAAAGDVSAPVILVDGTATTLDTATRNLLVQLGVTDVKITGSSLSVSTQIANAIDAIPNVTVHRLEGSNRYTTSVAINQDAFSASTSAYLAVGTGFADALSGAALAGHQGVPLFVVRNNCVPPETLAAMRAMGVTTVNLLGSANTLDANVFALRSC